MSFADIQPLVVNVSFLQQRKGLFVRKIITVIALVVMSSTALAEEPVRIENSPSLNYVFDLLARIFEQGPDFNSLYYDENFSLIVVEAGDKTPTSITAEVFVDHLDQLITDALEWADARQEVEIMKYRAQALSDFRRVLQDESYERYFTRSLRRHEIVETTFYVGVKYRLLIEKTWAR